MSAPRVPDPCAMPLGTGQTCVLPGDDPHYDGCEPPRVRCRCSHGASTHTGGYGRCWSLSCACDKYRDPSPARLPEHLRTDDIQDYLRQKGEIA